LRDAFRAKGTAFTLTNSLVAMFAPTIFVFVVIGAVASPIVLRWLQNIDKGFSSVITVLMLMLDAFTPQQTMRPVFLSSIRRGSLGDFERRATHIK
jgi:hypothetical protein